MTEQTIAFELISPEESLVSEPVAMAVIPGTEGELGIGPGHASFVVALKPGVVRLFVEDAEKGDSRDIFIAGGFADITGQRCTVLAEEAINLSDLSRDKLDAEVKTLIHDITLAEEAFDKARLSKRLDLVRMQIDALAA